MATRRIIRDILGGLRWVLPFITLPALTVLLIYGGHRGTAVPWLASMTNQAPEQVVLDFVREIGSGQSANAREVLSPPLRRLDPGFLGLRLKEDYGAPVFTTAKTLLHTADYAVISSDTRTDQGCRYLITWTLQRQGQRWVIVSYGDLRYLLPDIKGAGY